MCDANDPRCTLPRTRVTQGAEQQYAGEKTYTTYMCGNALPCEAQHAYADGSPQPITTERWEDGEAESDAMSDLMFAPDCPRCGCAAHFGRCGNDNCDVQPTVQAPDGDSTGRPVEIPQSARRAVPIDDTEIASLRAALRVAAPRPWRVDVAGLLARIDADAKVIAELRASGPLVWYDESDKVWYAWCDYLVEGDTEESARARFANGWTKTISLNRERGISPSQMCDAHHPDYATELAELRAVVGPKMPCGCYAVQIDVNDARPWYARPWYFCRHGSALPLPSEYAEWRRSLEGRS